MSGHDIERETVQLVDSLFLGSSFVMAIRSFLNRIYSVINFPNDWMSMVPVRSTSDLDRDYSRYRML